MASRIQAAIDINSYNKSLDNDDTEDDVHYIDAMKEVDNELEVFAPARDYIEHLPSVHKRSFNTLMIDHEHLRIENSKSPISSDETNSTPLPSSTTISNAEEQASWIKSLNKVKVDLEYKQRELANLEFIKSYGSPIWEQYLEQVESLANERQNRLDMLRKLRDDINGNGTEEKAVQKPDLNELDMSN